MLSGAPRSSRGLCPHYRYSPDSWLASGFVKTSSLCCLVWVGGVGVGVGGGFGSTRFGHANEFMGDWLIKGQAGSWPDFVFEGNIIVRCRSDMMTKLICRLVLIELVKHGGQNYDKRLLMTDLGGTALELGEGDVLSCCVTVPFCQL